MVAALHRIGRFPGINGGMDYSSRNSYSSGNRRAVLTRSQAER
jgi:hypothetical protein